MNEATQVTQLTQPAPPVDINYILSVQDSIRDKAKRFIKHIDSVVPDSKEKHEAIEEIQSAVALCCTGLMNFYNTQKGTN